MIALYRVFRGPSQFTNTDLGLVDGVIKEYPPRSRNGPAKSDFVG